MAEQSSKTYSIILKLQPPAQQQQSVVAVAITVISMYSAVHSVSCSSPRVCSRYSYLFYESYTTAASTQSSIKSRGRAHHQCGGSSQHRFTHHRPHYRVPGCTLPIYGLHRFAASNDKLRDRKRPSDRRIL